MKKTYQIEVDCANCANLMEEATKKTEGVADAVVNFMTQKMTVEFAEGQDPKAVMKAVLKNCKKVEDDCEIYLEEILPLPSPRTNAPGRFLRQNSNSPPSRRSSL